MSRISSIVLTGAVLSLAVLLTPPVLPAQAPAGPLPAAQPQTPPPAPKPQEQQPRAERRTSIVGQWKLNVEESDDPRKKLEQARSDGSSGRRGGPGISIGGFPIGGPGGIGGGRGGVNGKTQQRLQEVITPAFSLSLAQKNPKDPEVDLTDDQNRKSALFTDGRKLQKPNPKDDSYQEIAAHWDGARLVTDEKSPSGGKMSRTFELSGDGAQLYETLRVTTGRSSAPLEVRYVYDPASSSAPPAN